MGCEMIAFRQASVRRGVPKITSSGRFSSRSITNEHGVSYQYTSQRMAS